MYSILFIILPVLIFPNLTCCDAFKAPIQFLRGANSSKASTTIEMASPLSTFHGLRPTDVKLQMEHAIELQQHAEESRRITEDTFPNRFDHEILALERLHRVALYSIKLTPFPTDICFAFKWQKWWETIHPPSAYDTRLVEERFYAYIAERQLGFIHETSDIARFEERLSEDYMELSALRHRNDPIALLVLRGLDSCSLIL